MRIGWIVTFIIEKRGGGPSSGYISTGFFLGLTLGRIALLWINQKVGTALLLRLPDANTRSRAGRRIQSHLHLFCSGDGVSLYLFSKVVS